MSKKQSTYKVIFSIITVILLIIIDLLTKSFAVTALQDKDIILISNVLELHYLENTGAAFSILTGKMGFFYIITIVMCIAILLFMKKIFNSARFTPLYICLVFLLSGAIGNFYDRLTLHYVRDFIYFSLINFPIFNVADIYVTCSVFVIIFLILFKYKESDFNE